MFPPSIRTRRGVPVRAVHPVTYASTARGTTQQTRGGGSIRPGIAPALSDAAVRGQRGGPDGHAGCRNRAMTLFSPTVRNRTVSFAFGPEPSQAITSPSPNWAWRTRNPITEPSSMYSASWA